MKSRFYSSLGVKLFGLMSVLTLLIVGATALTNLPRLKNVITNSVNDQTRDKTDYIAQQVNSQLREWDSLIVGSASTIKIVGDKVDPLQLQNLVNINEKDLLAFQIFSVKNSLPGKVNLIGSAFAKNPDSTNLEGKGLSEVYATVQAQTAAWVASRAIKATNDSVMIQSLSKESGLLLANIARTKTDSATGSTITIVLTVWQSKIVRILEKGGDIKVVLVDRQGRVFSSADMEEMTNHASYSDSKLFKSARSQKVEANDQIVPQLVNKFTRNKSTYIGAYARIPRYDDLTILSQIDYEWAISELSEARGDILLWAIVFVLIAVLLSFVGASQITKGLVQVTKATNRIAAGDFAFRLDPKSNDEVGVLGHAINTMSTRIVTLMQTQLEKAKIEQELETAKMVQSTFFPKHDIEVGPVKLAGYYQPATQCGGDLWGHFTVRPGVELVYIADVMGHGGPAALVTAMAYSTCMTISDLMKDYRDLSGSPSKLLDRMNRIILDAVGGSISMTCFAVLIDTNTGKMTYSNAGHNFPAIIPMNAEDSRNKKKKDSANPTPISLQLRGVPLGIDAAAEFTEKTIDLHAGDKIFFFTDGLIECTSPQGAVWGRKVMFEEIIDVISANKDADAATLRTEISQRAFSFFGEVPIADDVTILVAELSRNWVAKSLDSSEEIPSNWATQEGRTSKKSANSMPSEPGELTDSAAASFQLPPLPGARLPGTDISPTKDWPSLPQVPFTEIGDAAGDPVTETTKKVHEEIARVEIEVNDMLLSLPDLPLFKDNFSGTLGDGEEFSSMELIAEPLERSSQQDSPSESNSDQSADDRPKKRKFKINFPA